MRTVSRSTAFRANDRAVAVVDAGRRLGARPRPFDIGDERCAGIGAGRDRHSRRAPRPAARRAALRFASSGSPPVWRRTVPARSTMAFSMSTNAPDKGRFDQRGSAVTWKSTMRPFRRDRRRHRAACRREAPPRPPHRAAPSGSASTWRFTTTSAGASISAKGLSAGNAPIGCGSSQESEPPSSRSPWRSLTGSSASIVVAARLGLAKRSERAAAFDPFDERRRRGGRQRSRFRQHDDRGAAVDQRLCRLADAGGIGGEQVGCRRERPLDIGERLDTRDAIRVGALGWLMAHGSGLTLGATTVGVTPLGLSALCAMSASGSGGGRGSPRPTTTHPPWRSRPWC